MNVKMNFTMPGQDGPAKAGRGLGRLALLAAGIAVVVLLLANGFYIIGEQENAVVTTFGVPHTVSTSGLHFKIPFIQQVQKVDMTIKGIPIGYDSQTNESYTNESLMITSDLNFVNVDFFLEYRVVDPVAYLYASEEPTLILRTLAQSYIRDTIGLYPEEGIGLQVVNMTIQDAEPPTAEVLAAFKEVENAKQGAETAVNNANKYRSEQLPAAEAQADQVRQNAQAAKESRINEANGQVARFNEMYEEYIKYPAITKQRMYYEAMEDVLPGLRVVITDGSGTRLDMFDLNDIAPAAAAAEDSQ